MKLLTLLIVLALILSAPAFASGQKEGEPPMEKEMTGDEKAGMMGDEKAEMKGALIEFTDADKVMMLAESAPTVLFFHASWCPGCRSGEEDINMNAAKLEGINIIKVDYDNSADLQKKYGITSQHSFVQIDAMGEALAKWSGGGSSEILNNIVKKEM